jgi:hypothetical protein
LQTRSTTDVRQVRNAPESLTARDVIQLQRTVGNRAVSQHLAIAPAGDRYEREADRVADQVVRAGDFGGRLERGGSGGASLSPAMRGQLESRFGVDFSRVRVHTDGDASRISREIGTQAFTHGSDIYVDSAKYSPGTRAGDRLLAHELTHVAQQNGGTRVSRAPVSIQRLITGEAFEQDTKLTTKVLFRTVERPGKSGATIAGFVQDLKTYHNTLKDSGVETKLGHLETLYAKVKTWLNTRGQETKRDGSRKSSRYWKISDLADDIESEVTKVVKDSIAEQPSVGAKVDQVENLLEVVDRVSTKWGEKQHLTDVKTYLTTEIDNLGVERLNRPMVTDVDVSEEKGSYTKGWNSGALSSVDLVKYKTGFTPTEKGFNKSGKEKFTGVFKPLESEDKKYGGHRGTEHGIPQMHPNFHLRTLAMYELDKVLNANIIPPTFLARHGDKVGTVMKKVEGKTASDLFEIIQSNSRKRAFPKMWGGLPTKEEQEAEEKALRIQKDPKYRQTLSILYLLDVIAGQVDRHDENYMVVMEKGVVKGVQGIDNDLSFGEKYGKEAFEGKTDVFGKRPHQLTEIDHDFANEIIKASESDKKDEIRRALTGLLSEKEIGATIDRLGMLANFLRPLMKKKDGPIVTKWE